MARCSTGCDRSTGCPVRCAAEPARSRPRSPNWRAATGGRPTDIELSTHLKITAPEFQKWLNSIASTTVGPLDRALVAGSEPRTLSGDVPDTPASIVEDGEVRRLVRGEVKRLPDREKMVLSLYYDEGLTLAEIGGVLGVTESRVSQIHTKAVLHLRARLSASGVT